MTSISFVASVCVCVCVCVLGCVSFGCDCGSCAGLLFYKTQLGYIHNRERKLRQQQRSCSSKCEEISMPRNANNVNFLDFGHFRNYCKDFQLAFRTTFNCLKKNNSMCSQTQLNLPAVAHELLYLTSNNWWYTEISFRLLLFINNYIF